MDIQRDLEKDIDCDNEYDGFDNMVEIKMIIKVNEIIDKIGCFKDIDKIIKCNSEDLYHIINCVKSSNIGMGLSLEKGIIHDKF